jgi:hypothetical protein
LVSDNDDHLGDGSSSKVDAVNYMIGGMFGVLAMREISTKSLEENVYHNYLRDIGAAPGAKLVVGSSSGRDIHLRLNLPLTP